MSAVVADGNHAPLGLPAYGALPLFFLQYASSGEEGFPGHTGKKIGRLSEEFFKHLV
jgi:hypothetical protein